jgi:hypothetical protein
MMATTAVKEMKKFLVVVKKKRKRLPQEAEEDDVPAKAFKIRRHFKKEEGDEDFLGKSFLQSEEDVDENEETEKPPMIRKKPRENPKKEEKKEEEKPYWCWSPSSGKMIFFISSKNNQNLLECLQTSGYWMYDLLKQGGVDPPFAKQVESSFSRGDINVCLSFLKSLPKEAQEDVEVYALDKTLTWTEEDVEAIESLDELLRFISRQSSPLQKTLKKPSPLKEAPQGAPSKTKKQTQKKPKKNSEDELSEEEEEEEEEPTDKDE